MPPEWNNRSLSYRITQRNAGLPLSESEFHRLVVEHGAVLYRMAYRMVGNRHEAEDVVQETFRSAWKSRQGYQSGRGQRAWLVSILRRRVVDRWRRRDLTRGAQPEFTDQIEVQADDPLANDYTDEMQHALDRLPAELRDTLLLVVVGELTHQDVADMLKIPLGTVLSRVSRGRVRLREYWLSESRSSAG
jgi:RNA polymerase sigma-70 factor (ECF subfamily)